MDRRKTAFFPRLTASLLFLPMALASAAHAASSASVDAAALQKQRKSYAECLVRHAPGPSAELALASDYSEKAFARRLDAMKAAMRNCLSGVDADAMRASGFMLRGEVAQALIDLKMQAPRPYQPPQLDALPAGRRATAAQEVIATSLASCMVKIIPKPMAMLQAAVPESDEEKRIFKALQPAVVHCAGDDPKVAISPAALRAALSIVQFGATADAKAASGG